MRRFMDAARMLEGIFDEPEEPADGSPVGSFGWWVFPDGQVDEMEEAGNHGWIADQWLTGHNVSDPDMPYEDAIDVLVQHGGVRVATFHGSDSLALDLPPKLLPAVRNALLKLLRDTRSDFNQYYLGGQNPKSLSFREVIAAIQSLNN